MPGKNVGRTGFHREIFPSRAYKVSSSSVTTRYPGPPVLTSGLDRAQACRTRALILMNPNRCSGMPLRRDREQHPRSRCSKNAGLNSLPPGSPVGQPRGKGLQVVFIPTARRSRPRSVAARKCRRAPPESRPGLRLRERADCQSS